MTEVVMQCPAHRIDTAGSDSYSWNTEKKIGICRSCGLQTCLGKDGDLLGRYDGQGKWKPIKGVEGLVEGSSEDDYDYEPKGVVELTDKGKYTYEDYRGIFKGVNEFFDIRTYKKVPWKAKVNGVWEEGVSDEVVGTYPNGAKKGRRIDLPKDHPAHFWSSGTFDTLFGMDKFPIGCSKKLTIVEGDLFDTPSAYQMLQSSNYTNPVVSVPSANPKGSVWKNCEKYLSSFDEIILATDNDEAGSKVASAMFDLYGHKMYTMNFGDIKDPNDFLTQGKGKEFRDAWWKKAKYTPTGFTSGVDNWLKALDEENPYTYTPTPIKAFNEVARGIVKGGITILKAPPGSGKSSLLRWLEYDQVTNRGCKVAVLMMEEMKSITARSMATQALGSNVMTREDASLHGISEDQVKEAVTKVVEGDKFISFEVNPQDPINDTLEKCKQAVLFYDVDYIYIDHLQRLAYLAGTDGATANLTELGVKLTEFAKRKDIGIVCISHINEDGHTKYAKSIEEEAIVLIELSRDKKSEDYDERNTSYLEISKNRPFGSTGPAGALSYDPETTILTERLGPQEPETPKRGKEEDEIPF